MDLAQKALKTRRKIKWSTFLILNYQEISLLLLLLPLTKVPLLLLLGCQSNPHFNSTEVGDIKILRVRWWIIEMCSECLSWVEKCQGEITQFLPLGVWFYLIKHFLHFKQSLPLHTTTTHPLDTLSESIKVIQIACLGNCDLLGAAMNCPSK